MYDSKMLQDKTRHKILHILAGGEKSAGEIAKHFDVSWPNISHHLSILKNVELITDRKEGQFIYYALNRKALICFLVRFMTMTNITYEEIEEYKKENPVEAATPMCEINADSKDSKREQK